MALKYRVFFCARCGKLAIICSTCDKGNRYCSPECASEAREEIVCEAKSRYRNSEDGRITQKFRQRRHRSRLGADVTDQSSSVSGRCETNSGTREQRMEDRGSPGPDGQPAPPGAGTFGGQYERPERTVPVWRVIRCDFCGRICGVVRECGSSFRWREQNRREGRREREEAQEEEKMDRDAQG